MTPHSADVYSCLASEIDMIVVTKVAPRRKFESLTAHLCYLLYAANEGNTVCDAKLVRALLRRTNVRVLFEVSTVSTKLSS